MSFITLDGNRYRLAGEIRPRFPQFLPPVQLTTPQALKEHFGLAQIWQIGPPNTVGTLHPIGKPAPDIEGQVWNTRNLNPLWPGAIYRGFQKQSTTVPAGTIQYTRLQEKNGDLYALSRRTSLVSGGQAVTRLYFHAATDGRGFTYPSVSPWTSVIGSSAWTMNPTIGASQTSQLAAQDFSTADFLLGRFVSSPLASQTIAAQNWTLNIARGSTSTASPENWACRLFAYRPSSQKVVGYIIGSSTAVVGYSTAGPNTLPDTEQSYQDGAFSGSAVEVQDGDVLVLEVGTKKGTTTGSYTATLYWGGATVTTTDNTTVSDHASFLESTNALTFSGAAPTTTAGRLVRFTSPATWTDSTVDTDTGLNYCQAIEMAGERLLALSAFIFGGSGGQDFNVTAQSWDGTSWEAGGLQVQNNFLFVDMANVGGSLYLLYVNDVTYPTWWRLATLTGANFDTLTTQVTVAATELPKALVSFPDTSQVEQPWVAAADGLYMKGTRILPWQNPSSEFTGQLIRTVIGGTDALLWSDGPAVYLGFWNNDVFTVKNLSQELADGLPTEEQGDVTSLFAVTERPWVVASLGGQDGSHNATIYIYNFGYKNKPPGWLNIYYNSTANRRVRAVGVSREDDETARLHFFEDNATSGDSDGFFFEHFLTEPSTLSTFAYAASGTLTTPHFWGAGVSPLKGFLAAYVSALNLSTAKRIGLEVASDEGSFGTIQYVTDTTDPPVLWLNGSTGGGISARRIQLRITLEDTAGATSTIGPTLRAVDVYWRPKAARFNGSLLREWLVPVSLMSSDYPDERIESVFARLQSTLQKRTLVKFSFGPQSSGGGGVIDAWVEAEAEDAQISLLPAGSGHETPLQIRGVVQLRLREVGP